METHHTANGAAAQHIFGVVIGDRIAVGILEPLRSAAERLTRAQHRARLQYQTTARIGVAFRALGDWKLAARQA